MQKKKEERSNQNSRFLICKWVLQCFWGGGGVSIGAGIGIGFCINIWYSSHTRVKFSRGTKTSLKRKQLLVLFYQNTIIIMVLYWVCTIYFWFITESSKLPKVSSTSRSVLQQSFQVTKSTREITSLLNVGGGMLDLLYIVSVIQNLCGNTNRLFD